MTVNAGNQIDKEKNQMDNTDMDRYFAQKLTQEHTIPKARPKQLCMKTKKKAAAAANPVEKDKGRPKLEKMELKKIPVAIWPQVESNRKNLQDSRLWDFLLISLQDQDDDRVRQFLKNSNYGARSTFLIDENRIQFTPESISKSLRLFQGEGSMDTEVSDMRDEDLIPIFEKNSRTSKGFALEKAKGIWKEWLAFVNERLLMAEDGLEYMSEKGVAAAIMSWNGIQLSWGNIVFEQIKVELNKKQARAPLRFYSTIYLSNLTKPPVHLNEGSSRLPPLPPHPAYAMTQPPPINWITEEQEELEEEMVESLQRKGKKRRVEQSPPPVFEVRQRPKDPVDTMNLGPDLNTAGSSDDLKKKLHQQVTENIKHQITITKGKVNEINLKKELDARIEEIAKLKEEKGNLIKISEELLEESTPNKKLEEAQSKAKKLQLDLIAQSNEFQKLNTLKTDISSQCTWERKEKERLQEEIKVLKRNPLLELETAKKSQNPVDVPEPQNCKALKIELDIVHKANSKYKKQLEASQIELDRLRMALWDQDKLSPPSFSLFHAYEIQRGILLKILGIDRGANLDGVGFDRAWRVAGKYSQQNLLCETIARGDINLIEPKRFFHPIGHLGARVLMYYLELENQLHYRRQMDSAEQPYREIKIDPVENQLLNIIQKSSSGEYSEWKETLKSIMVNLKSRDTLLVKMSYTYERECRAQRGELGTGHYVFATSQTFNQIAQMVGIQEPWLQKSNRPSDQVQLNLPPISFTAPAWCLVNTPVTGSQQKITYLGNYDNLFDFDYEKPLPTWRAMRWILEDYGMSRGEEWSWPKIYKKVVDDTWSHTPPLAVRSNGHFCRECDRRFKWAPEDTIDSVEYNWPIIPGQFDSAPNCAEAFLAFWEKHHKHTDPVCFRAAIFAKFLHYICSQFGVIVNVNQFDIRHPEFHVNLKLRYHHTRWQRMVELMSMMHFFYGANGGFINEFGTKKIAVDNWLRTQGDSRSQLLLDDDVRKEVTRLQALELRKNQTTVDHHRNRKINTQ